MSQTTVQFDPERIELVRREIRAMRNGLESALSTRRHHPTYGVSKHSLRRRLAQIEGALFAYLWATGRNHADVEGGAREAAVELGINLSALRDQIEAS